MSGEPDQSVAVPGADQRAPVSGLDGFGIAEKLRAAGIPLTLQRLAVGQVMLAGPVHLTADQVLTRVRALIPEISRATVYNTLKLFGEKGLVRELVVEADRIVFDSNATHHHHLYDVETGELTDVETGSLRVIGMPLLPDSVQLESLDVVVRVRRRKA